MADSSGFDISNRYTSINETDSAYINRTEAEKALKKLYEDKSTLSFTDMLGLMIAEFQNQTIDNQASTTDMMNQLVQMSSMQAMTEMSANIQELTLANVMSYSRSLLNEWVTLGVYDSNGELQEIYGRVDGVGTFNGQQVVFVNGQSYYLSSIMAVGKLPDKAGAPAGSETPEEPEDEGDIPTAPVEDNGNPDIDDDGNPIDNPTPPIKDDGAVDDPDPEYNGENGAETEGVG